MGGFSAAAKQLQLVTQRSPKHSLASSEQTAQALQDFMTTHPPPCDPSKVGPHQATSARRRRSTSTATTLGASAASAAAKSLLAAAGLSRSHGLACHDSSSASSNGVKGGRGTVEAWRVLPTQKQLKAAGRPDLAAALQRHGARSVAQLLGLPVAARGPKKKVSHGFRLADFQQATVLEHLVPAMPFPLCMLLG
jgi:hypothetical protein